MKVRTFVQIMITQCGKNDKGRCGREMRADPGNQLRMSAINCSTCAFVSAFSGKSGRRVGPPK